MKKRNAKKNANLLVLCVGIGLFFASDNSPAMRLLAQFTGMDTQQNTTPAATDTQQDQSPASDGSSQQMSLLQEAMTQNSSQQLLDDQMAKRQAFLQEIKDQLQAAQSDYMDINHNVKDTQNKLSDVQEQQTTLSAQVDILTQQIQNTVQIMQNVLMQIGQKENQVEILKGDIQIKNVEIDNQKKMLSEYLTILYKDENSMDDTTNKDDAVNIAKLLLSDKSPDEALRELRYFNILEATGHEIFDKLQNLVTTQESEQINLENSRNKLEMLYRQLQDQQSTLEMQQQAKAQLLQETQGQQTIYQQLLDQTKQEQGQSMEDIQSLSDNLKFIQDKITELGDKFNPDDYKSVLDQQTTNVYQYMKDNPDGDFQPLWPVSPSRGISAYFHDPSYLLAMGVPHEAIDIRTPQSTPIHAPANGVVYKTRDNGYGYSYIILAHSGGFMTLYGHVSDIMVQEGQVIKQGQIIGLSGATPGTKGAGLMTTGPHLHFEVMKGGKHVDPLDYLPLAYLPLDSLPAKYLSRITGDPTNVSRTAPEDMGVATDSEQIIQMADINGNAEVGASQQAADMGAP